MTFINNITLQSLLDSGNSSTLALGNGGVFTGEWIDTLNYGTATVSVLADQDSATGGLVVQYSDDGVDVIQDDRFTITKNIGKVFSFGMANRYMRVVYTNGVIAQTVFNLQTILKTAPIKNSSHNISDNIVADDDAELVKAVITGKRDDGVFGNIMMDNENNLRVNSFPYTYSIAKGVIAGHTSLLKFGTRTSVAANTQSVVWEGNTALYTYMSTAQQLKVSSTSNQDSSAGTGIRTLTLEGLDANFAELTETITMDGTNVVTTAGSFIRIFRAFGATCGTSLTNVGKITITNNAGTTEQAVINAGDGQTLMTIWTVPAGKNAYLVQASVSTDSNKGARVSMFTRLNDGGTLYPWQIKYRAFIFSGNESLDFQIPFKVPAKTDIEIRITTPASAGVTSVGSTFELWYEDN